MMARVRAKVLGEIRLQTVGEHLESQRDWEASPRLDDFCRCNWPSKEAAVRKMSDCCMRASFTTHRNRAHEGLCEYLLISHLSFFFSSQKLAGVNPTSICPYCLLSADRFYSL